MWLWSHPPSEWTLRHIDWDDYGLKVPSARPRRGERARYWGDNFTDPPYATPGNAPLTNDHKHRLKRTFNQRNPALLSGTATDDSENGWYLRDAAKDWYHHGKFMTHSGTAASGGSGHLTTSNADGFWTGSRLVGLILKLADGSEVPITGQDGATIQFPPELGVTAGVGVGFTIDEPRYEANTFMKRLVEVTDLSTGTKHVRTITHNSDKTLFGRRFNRKRWRGRNSRLIGTNWCN